MPGAYGLAAIAWTFTGFAALFTDLGLGAALVQSRDMTERDAATAFVINAITGLALTLVVDRAAPSAGQPFRPAARRTLLALASLAFTLSLNVVPFAILERQL